MVTIKDSCETSASLDRVWDVVAAVDDDPKYWQGLDDVKNISRTGNTIEREVKVGFMNHTARQTVVLNPKKSIEITMTKGPMIGTRSITLTPLGIDTTRIDASWNFEFAGIPGFAQNMVKGQIEKTTRLALTKIAETAEKTSNPTAVSSSSLGEKE